MVRVGNAMILPRAECKPNKTRRLRWQFFTFGNSFIYFCTVCLPVKQALKEKAIALVQAEIKHQMALYLPVPLPDTLSKELGRILDEDDGGKARRRQNS
jgi:hypothetical protein